MIKKEFPILEFDENKNGIIRPHYLVEDKKVPETCVLCFFSKAIETIITENEHRITAWYNSEAFKFPIYEIEYKGKKIGLLQAGVGAPVAAAQVEEMAAMGCKKLLACGSCGVLNKDMALGHLIIPVSAVRDEGTSYHYCPPSREIEADSYAVACIEKVLREKCVPYIKGKTWTTDAIYRETPEKIKFRKEEGCITVEMETSAYIAVSRFNDVAFGQILYAGDNLGGEQWDKRGYTTRDDIRELVLRITLDTAILL